METYKSAQTWLSKERRAASAYVHTQEQTGMVEFHRKNIQSYASGAAAVGYGTTSLHYLGGYYAAQGCDAVWRGDPRGTEAIDLACSHRTWLVIVLARAYDLDPRPDKQPRIDMWDVTAAWLHARAVGASEALDRLSSIIRRVNQGDDLVRGRAASPLATLATHWSIGTEIARLEGAGWAKLESYAPLASPTMTAEQLDKLCFEYIRQVKRERDDTLLGYPYRLIPFHLLAWARVFSFDLTASSHPLLSSPLARPRTVSELPASPELEAFLSRARIEFNLERP